MILAKTTHGSFRYIVDVLTKRVYSFSSNILSTVLVLRINTILRLRISSLLYTLIIVFYPEISR